MVEAELKLLPVAVIVNAAAPAVTLSGESDVRTGVTAAV